MNDENEKDIRPFGSTGCPICGYPVLEVATIAREDGSLVESRAAVEGMAVGKFKDLEDAGYCPVYDHGTYAIGLRLGKAEPDVSGNVESARYVCCCCDLKWENDIHLANAFIKESMTRKRKPIPKKVRKAVYDKYNGRCAYCGKEIEMKEMQVDHVKPLAFFRGTDDIDNLLPACRRCNFYKDTRSIEGFRKMLKGIPDRLKENGSRSPLTYNLALQYGMVVETGLERIEFHFEKCNKEGKNENDLCI